MSITEELKQTLIELDIDEIAGKVQAALDSGLKAQEVLSALTEGMDEVGRLYETQEYYLTELVLAGETMKEAFAILQPHLKAGDQGNKNKVITLTVKGDNHDIGKNILASLLLSAGFEVIDLGMDVHEDKVVQTVKETGAKVIAMSSLLTMTVEEISTVDQVLKKEGLRDKVKIIAGGAPLNMELAKKLGADDYADDAVEGVRHIKALFH
ncbi:MAG: cobalamin-dependent protein [Candidatus Lokiarchaeota archaeon]|nr:cobalamin-dependent protein [Candidatus Lokiarchaeota archaeon]